MIFEVRVNASGITWLGGLTPSRVQTPHCESSLHLAKFVTLWNQAIVANAIGTTHASGSNPGGRAK
jgi:hypothetical protein